MKPEVLVTGATPQDKDLEQIVIGSLLLDPERMVDVVGLINTDCFYGEENKAIYSVMQSMYDKGEHIDLYTVTQGCIATNQPKTIASYIAGTTTRIGSGVGLERYVQVLRQKFIARQITNLGTELIRKSLDETEDVAETMEFLQKATEQVCDVSFVGDGPRHIGSVMSDALKEAENRASRAASGKTTGITTGLRKLNNATAGFQGGQLVILGARPAMGKTALMLSMAKSAAKDGIPVCLFSLEMSDISLANRLLLSETNIDSDNFRRGTITSAEWKELEEASSNIGRLPIYVEDKPVMSMRQIKSIARKMKRQGRCEMIMVDYLQLSDVSSDKRNRNREQEISEASRQAKIIAKELNIPFILLSQLSRECEKRADKTPILSDLRESGAIEQDADMVIFLTRPEYYGMDSYQMGGVDHDTKGLGVLSIAKQRDGMTGIIPFSYNTNLTKIWDYGETAFSEPIRTGFEVEDGEPF